LTKIKKKKIKKAVWRSLPRRKVKEGVTVERAGEEGEATS
jgi:RNase P protein component